MYSPELISGKPRSQQPHLRVLVDRHSCEQWDAFAQQFSNHSIYQSWAFGQTHNLGWLRGVSRFVLLDRDRPSIMAQLRIKRFPFSRVGVADVAWGPLCREDSWENHDQMSCFLNAVKTEYLEKRGLQIRFEPRGSVNDRLFGAMAAAFESHGFIRDVTARAYRSIFLDLRQDLRSLRSSLHPKWRNSLVAAEKANMQVIQGAELKHFDRFKRIYDAMWTAKKFPSGVRVEWVRRIFADFPDKHPLRVFLAQDGGKDVAGGVFSATGDTALYYLGASAPGERDGRSPGYLLHWHVIQSLKHAGFTWYDLGGLLDQPNSGVDRFKNRTNGRRVVFPGRFETPRSGYSWRLFHIAEKLYGRLRLRLQQFH